MKKNIFELKIYSVSKNQYYQKIIDDIFLNEIKSIEFESYNLIIRKNKGRPIIFTYKSLYEKIRKEIEDHNKLIKEGAFYTDPDTKEKKVLERKNILNYNIYNVIEEKYVSSFIDFLSQKNYIGKFIESDNYEVIYFGVNNEYKF